jgi:hypothetical protein
MDGKADRLLRRFARRKSEPAELQYGADGSLTICDSARHPDKTKLASIRYFVSSGLLTKMLELGGPPDVASRGPVRWERQSVVAKLKEWNDDLFICSNYRLMQTTRHNHPVPRRESPRGMVELAPHASHSWSRERNRWAKAAARLPP